MKQFISTFSLLLIMSAAGVAQAQTPKELYGEWQKQHITNIDPSRARYNDLKRYLERLRGDGIEVREVGRSLAGRSIYQLEFGKGPLKVFMWSQMHGDEPTATSALVDLFYYLHRNRGAPWVAAIEKRITLRAVPMLNPDGAELYQRRNLQFIDINRDARALATPEGRLLKKLRDEWSPDIGFNLHNQGSRTAVGESGRQATISLLAVPADASGNDSPGLIRNKKLCAIIVEALSPFIYGHIGRYDDSFNPRAFGDMISQWGTPVILIETGALRGKSEMDLVQLNFIAYAAALSALANGRVEEANPALYDALRTNTSNTIFNLIVRHAMVVNRFESGQVRVPPFIADIAINQDTYWNEGKQERESTIQDIGDLSIFYGLEEVDATGYYVTSASGVLRPGAKAALLFYKKDRASQINWTVPDLEARFRPDAVYRNGEWSGATRLVK